MASLVSHQVLILHKAVHSCYVLGYTRYMPCWCLCTVLSVRGWQWLVSVHTLECMWRLHLQTWIYTGGIYTPLFCIIIYYWLIFRIVLLGKTSLGILWCLCACLTLLLGQNLISTFVTFKIINEYRLLATRNGHDFLDTLSLWQAQSCPSSSMFARGFNTQKMVAIVAWHQLGFKVVVLLPWQF